MTESTDLTADALYRFRERALYLCELMTTTTDPDSAEVEDLPEVLVREAALLVREGPEAYIRHVQRLDQAAVRQQLDRELDELLRDDGRPSSPS